MTLKSGDQLCQVSRLSPSSFRGVYRKTDRLDCALSYIFTEFLYWLMLHVAMLESNNSFVWRKTPTFIHYNLNA